MCRLSNIAMGDYQESVTTGQTRTDGQTDAGQSDPYVPLCFAGNTKINNKIINNLFLCHLRSIAAHRDHFVRRLSVRPSVSVR